MNVHGDDHRKTSRSRRMVAIKKRLKAFERKFAIENGRKPSIEDTPDEVRKLTHEYTYLKTSCQSDVQTKQSNGRQIEEHDCGGDTLNRGEGTPVEGRVNPVAVVVTESLPVKPRVRSSTFSKALNKDIRVSSGSSVILPSMDKLRAWKKPPRQAEESACDVSEKGKVVVNSENDFERSVLSENLGNVNSNERFNSSRVPLGDFDPETLVGTTQPTQLPCYQPCKGSSKPGGMYSVGDRGDVGEGDCEIGDNSGEMYSVGGRGDVGEGDFEIGDNSGGMYSVGDRGDVGEGDYEIDDSGTGMYSVGDSGDVGEGDYEIGDSVEVDDDNVRCDDSQVQTNPQPVSPDRGIPHGTPVQLSQPVVLGDDDQELTKLYSVDSSLYSTVRSQNTELLSMLKKRPHEQHTMSSESTRETLNREEAAERQDNDSDASQLPLKKHRKIVSKQNTDVSQNFVKLNMKIKRYKRKGQSVSQKYKKYRFGKGKNVCYKCGVKGHWARDCPTSQNLGTFDGAEVQYCSDGDRSESPDSDSQTVGIDEKQPSLGSTQEIQCSVECKVPEVDGNHTGSTSKGGQLSPGKKRTSKSSVKTKRPATKQNSFAYKKIASVESITEASLPLHTSHTSLSFSPVDPLYSVGDDMSDVLQGVLEKFGFVDFRTSQRKVIERILTGQSTLFVQSTGSGKSLCYQVPAYLYWERYKAITVVVSPLVSLMEDQVRNLPTCLSGACLHSNMDPKERQSVYDRMRAGSIAVLLVSPEAVVVDRGAGFWNALSSVAFVCIDEAHCVSQWSHNFRPSYLRICKIFYERCHISCFLGLTATATKSTVDSVAEYLKLPEEGVVQGQILPPNLRLSVSSDNDKDAALLHLLQSEPFRSCDSIIIYCTRQQSTERVAQSIRTCLQSLDSFAYLRSSEEDKRSRKMKTEVADCYHAGMSGHMRSRVQKKFMSGRLRIVAATVAFGMGLNKADVRAIIHYNMPRSFESYVQEIGRAGRDGKPAYCHVFLDLQDEDNNELRRHIHANSVDRFAVKQLISHLVIPPVSSCIACAPPTTTQEVSSKLASSNTAVEQVAKSGRRHLVAVNIAECVNACDVKEETLMTYLCYLEFEHWLEFSKTANDTCVLKFYGGRCQVDQLARKMDVVAAAIECNAVTGGGTQVELSFSISAVSNRVGRPWDEVQRQLYMLQYDDQGTGTTGGQRSGILVEFLHPSYIILVSCGYSPQDLDCMCDQLYNRVQQQESSDLAKLKLLHEALRKASLHDSMTLDTGSSELRSVIDNYFSDKLEAPKMKTTREVLDGLTEKQQVRVCRDIRSFLAIHEEHKVTARAIARIFHGISSPNFPADVWGRERRFWRSHINVDFHVLIKLAQEQIVTFLTVV